MRTKKKTPTEKNSEADSLMKALVEERLRIAKELDKPASAIFWDKDLLEIVDKRPANKRELMSIRGVNHYKLDAYGEYMLKVIKEFKG